MDSAQWDKDRRQFTASKLLWLEQVQDDPAMGPTALSVAFYIGRRLNRDTGYAWPSQGTIGDVVGVKPRQVRNVIASLKSAGHLRVAPGGFQKPDRYFAVLADRQPIAAMDADNPATHDRSGEDAQAGNPASPERSFSDRRAGNGLPPNPYMETLNEPVSLFESEPDTIQLAFDAYNALADRTDLPRARALSSSRRAALKARLKLDGLEGWNLVIQALEASPHHLGRNDRGWTADLDWILKPANYQRFLERGAAGPGPTPGPAKGGSYLDMAAQLAAANDDAFHHPAWEQDR